MHRDQWTASEDDALRPARGIVRAVLVGALLWCFGFAILLHVVAR